jgi:CDP-glycerol glycerophosphotransferase (TagB/SpsB family)
MFNIANEYEGKIQIAFKPHPMLKNKLYDQTCWGKEKTDQYYDSWENLPNGQLVLGDYMDLFLNSDAMIHDSGSFLIEYIYTGKPVLHTNRDEHITDRMNDFGILAFNLHYHAKKEEDIRAFIEDVLKGKDEKRQEREAFLASALSPPNHKSASENIYDEIVKQLF